MFAREIDGVRYEGSQIQVEGAEASIGVFVGLESAVRRDVLEHHRRSEDRRPHRQVGAKGVFDDLPGHPMDQGDLLAQRETFAAAEDGTAWVTWVER